MVKYMEIEYTVRCGKRLTPDSKWEWEVYPDPPGDDSKKGFSPTEKAADSAAREHIRGIKNVIPKLSIQTGLDWGPDSEVQ